MGHPTLLITGASRGLGEAIARAAAQKEANLVLAARSGDRLQDLAGQIETEENRTLAIEADVSQEEDCRHIIRQALERFGRIDALVNNAGAIEPLARIAQADPRGWQRTWQANLLGPLMLTQMALAHLRETNGRVINVSSGSTTTVVQGWGAYSSSKAALDHFTRILAAEEPGITALVVRPGLVDTQMQATIRERGKAVMAEGSYQWLSGLFEQGKLLPARVPGEAIACLALHAPHELSGEVLQWDDARVQELCGPAQ